MAALSTRDTVQVETDKSEVLVDALESERARKARQQERKERWERHEAERQARDREEYEELVRRRGEAAPERPPPRASAAPRPPLEPSTSELMASLGLKPGQVVTIAPRSEGE